MCMTTQLVEPERLSVAVATLKLLADETRLQILWALVHGEHSVGDLAAHVGVQPANVSQHLAKLRLGRLVRTRRDGNHVFYAAENVHVRRLVEQALFHAGHVHQGLPDHDDATEQRRVKATRGE
ncbi:MAG: metalloregulator ArsR/SmtB family transcription factor [Nitriliruptorales bacterium]|nr:metalloregulator ArsR/SmtB family transcription factor [Nitriliruptorales bacterium]